MSVCFPAAIRCLFCYLLFTRKANPDAGQTLPPGRRNSMFFNFLEGYVYNIQYLNICFHKEYISQNKLFWQKNIKKYYISYTKKHCTLMKMFSSGRPHLAAPTAAETADQNYVKHIFGKIMMKNNFENIMMKKFFLIVFRCQSSSIPTYI